MKDVAEGLRSTTMDRFRSRKSPEGKPWPVSLREQEGQGITLTQTTRLKQSIRAIADSTGAAVGTNTIYAATHQYGEDHPGQEGKVPEVPVQGCMGRGKEGDHPYPCKAIFRDFR